MKLSFAKIAGVYLVYMTIITHASSTEKPIPIDEEDMTLFTHLPDPVPIKETQPKAEFLSRIVGGQDAAPKEYPFMVSWHYYDTELYLPSCAGSLVAPNIVLSAAHCKDINGGVRIGSNYAVSSYAPYNEEVEVRNVIKKIVHPNYSSFSNYNDIMLLELDSKVDTSIFKPINLNFDEQEPAVNDMLTVIGFGRMSEGGSRSSTLQKVEVPANSHKTCRSQYGYSVHSKIHLCAGYTSGGKDSCQGDSGGPIFEEIDGVITQVGIVSFGSGCARPNKSGVYARVSGAKEWLKEEICSRSQDPKPSYCPGSSQSVPATPVPATQRQTPSPTPAPITAATVAPTPSPIISPTLPPTPFPTARRTSTPTRSPTPVPTPSTCMICEDKEAEWMTYQNIKCSSADDLLLDSCNKSEFWTNNNICQYSCFFAGNGYPGDNCCKKEDDEISVGVSTTTLPPTHMPTRSPQDISEDTNNCIQCDDIGNEWMVSVGMECPSSYLLETKCNKNAAWIENKSCQLSCYKEGYGYEGDICCGSSSTDMPNDMPTHPPSRSPVISEDINNCIQCDDIGNDWMISVGMECPSSYLLETKCNKNAAWTENKNCRLSCYNEGYGYEGDVCCQSNAKGHPGDAKSVQKSRFKLEDEEEDAQNFKRSFWY